MGLGSQELHNFASELSFVANGSVVLTFGGGAFSAIVPGSRLAKVWSPSKVHLTCKKKNFLRPIDMKPAVNALPSVNLNYHRSVSNIIGLTNLDKSVPCDAPCCRERDKLISRRWRLFAFS